MRIERPVMIEMNCSRCGSILRSDIDRHRLLHATCITRVERASGHMTPADWDAVAGWLDPVRTRLTGQAGSE